MTEDPIPGVDEYAKLLKSFAEKGMGMPDDEFLPPSPPPRKTNRKPAAPTIPMTPLGQEVCGRLKEMFYAYNNRPSEDNRSAQETLGPSEIGSPCDRRLALSLMRTPPVNPGWCGWPAFIGTAVHASLVDVLLRADYGAGRYATELPLTFPSQHVPKGTSDLLDRTLKMVVDHKVLGEWSFNKLRTEGPSETYRVQVHVYAYGARLQGEEVDHVAIAAWPRVKSSIDDLYIWTERYDPQIARDALARVDRIATEVKAHEAERATWAGLDITAQQLAIGRTFPIDNSDCKFCEFHAPGDADGSRGCNGRQ